MTSWIHLQLPFVCFLFEDLGATEPTLPELLKAWQFPKKKSGSTNITLIYKEKLFALKKDLQEMDLFGLFYQY